MVQTNEFVDFPLKSVISSIPQRQLPSHGNSGISVFAQTSEFNVGPPAHTQGEIWHRTKMLLILAEGVS